LLASDPRLEAGNHRLFIYLRVENHDLVVCLAHNGARKDILEQLQALLIQGREHTVYVYAEKVNAAIEEIVGGVDYEVYAVGVFIPDAQKNRVVVTGYGNSLLEAMKNVKWTDFLQRLLGKGVDAI